MTGGGLKAGRRALVGRLPPSEFFRVLPSSSEFFRVNSELIPSSSEFFRLPRRFRLLFVVSRSPPQLSIARLLPQRHAPNSSQATGNKKEEDAKAPLRLLALLCCLVCASSRASLSRGFPHSTQRRQGEGVLQPSVCSGNGASGSTVAHAQRRTEPRCKACVTPGTDRGGVWGTRAPPAVSAPALA